jgi:AcrR family transcriptional regulator
MDSGAVSLRRREHGKLDKRRRIGEAARAAFTEYGYKGANMREIAKRAGVATGTLFLYAPDKRSLLLWMINDDLERLTEETFAGGAAAVRAHDDLLDQLLYVFEARYRYWGADPDLALNALQELTTRNGLDQAGTHLAHYHDRSYVVREHLTELVRSQQARGRIRPGTDPDAVAQLVLMIYNAAIRAWLRTAEIDLTEALAELRKLLHLAIEGCSTGPIGRGAGGTSN